jgi:RimJ/RimL family protein N-acetyltransferase
LLVTRDLEDFARHAEAFLAGNIEHNVLATVLAHARGGRYPEAGPLACGLDGDRVCAAAMRMPPWPMLAAGFDATAAGALVAAWLAEDPQLPGVCGRPATVRAIAAAWSRHTGGRTGCRMRETMHELTEVRDPPRPGRGRLRLATAADRDLLIEWERAFAVEADVAGAAQAARSVDARMAARGQLVWDDDGDPVSTLGLSPAIAGVVRIGPVYTPPDRRRRGYASSAVAAASRRALAEGASRCMLFTDVANPTSNRIYASVGFRPFADWEEQAFAPPTVCGGVCEA